MKSDGTMAMKVILLSFCTVTLGIVTVITLVAASLPPRYVEDQRVERECALSQVQDSTTSGSNYIADCSPRVCKIFGNWDAQSWTCSIENYLHNNPNACADLDLRRNNLSCHKSEAVDKQCKPMLMGLNLYYTSCKGLDMREPSLNLTFQLPNCVSDSNFQAVKVDFQADCNVNAKNYFCKSPICRVFNYADSYSQEWLNYTDWVKVWYDCIAVGLKDGMDETHYYLALTHFPTEEMLNYSMVFRDVSIGSMRLAAAAWRTRQEAVVLFQPIPGIDKYHVVAQSQDKNIFDKEVTSDTLEIAQIESSYNIVTVTVTPADSSKCLALGWNCSPVSVTLPDKSSLCLPTILIPNEKLPQEPTGMIVLIITVTAFLSITVLGLAVHCYRTHTRGYRELIAIASLPEPEKEKVIHVLNKGRFKLHFLQRQNGREVMGQAKIILVFLYENDPDELMVEMVQYILENNQLWGRIWIVSVGSDQHSLDTFLRQENFSDLRCDEFARLMSGRELNLSDQHSITNCIRILKTAYDEFSSHETGLKRRLLGPSPVFGRAADLQEQRREMPRHSISSLDSEELSSELTAPSTWPKQFRYQANASAPAPKEPMQQPESLSGQNVHEDMDDEVLSAISEVSSLPSVYRQMKSKENSVVPEGFPAIPEGETDYDEPYERSDEERSLDHKHLKSLQARPTHHALTEAAKLQALASENRQNLNLPTTVHKTCHDVSLVSGERPLPSKGIEHPSVQNPTSSSSDSNLQSISQALNSGNTAHPYFMPSAYAVHTVGKLHQEKELKEADEFPFTYYDAGACDSMEVLTSSNYCPTYSESVPLGDSMPITSTDRLNLLSSMNSQASNRNEEARPQLFNGHDGGSFGTERYGFSPISSGDEQTTPKSSIHYEPGGKTEHISADVEQTNQHLGSPSLESLNRNDFERPELMTNSFSISDDDDLEVPFPAVAEGQFASFSNAKNTITETGERDNSDTIGSNPWKTILPTFDQEAGQSKMKNNFQKRLEELANEENLLIARGVSHGLDFWSPEPTEREFLYGRVTPDYELDNLCAQSSPVKSQHGSSSGILRGLPDSFPQVCGPPPVSGSRSHLSPSGGIRNGLTGPAGASSACRENEIPLFWLNGMSNPRARENAPAGISSPPQNSLARRGPMQAMNGLHAFPVRRPPETSSSNLNPWQNSERVCGPPVAVMSSLCLEDDEDDKEGMGYSPVYESRPAPLPRDARNGGHIVLDSRPHTLKNGLAEHHIDAYPNRPENDPESFVQGARAREPVEDVYISSTDYESGIGNSNSYTNSNF